MRIEEVTKNNLCISCGICAGICPKKCITSYYHNGSYSLKIDEAACINCGLCYNICPGKSIDYLKMYDMINETLPDDIMIGNFKKCYVVQTKDKNLLQKTSSGGFVTTLVKNLLVDEVYQSAFLVDTYNYSEEVFTQRYTKDDDLSSTPKSRYVTVNHSQAIKYILENRNERTILIGTPCFIQGFLQVVDHFKLNRENYLLLGLVCDKNMSYQIWNYFKAVFDEDLDHLYFRSKDFGGWAGNVILENQQNKWLLPKKARMIMKEYFCLERCLYCLDKLNQFADISCGDNYTKGQFKSTKEGSSNIIIRSARGEEIFQRCNEKFKINEITIDKIYDSQNLEARKNNYVYSVYKSGELGYNFNNLPVETACSIRENSEHKQKYKNLLQKLKMGQNADFPLLVADICKSMILPYKFILNVTNDLLDKKIIIYGAGGVGYSYYLQLYQFSRCEIVVWVDKNYSKCNYKEGKVESIDRINEVDFDLILIAVREESIANEIKNSLVQRGIDSKKLFWNAPVCN